VWCAAGRNAQTLQAFFDELDDRKATIRAVSIDMSGGYEKAIREAVPAAEIAFDPFHVVRLAQRAADLADLARSATPPPTASTTETAPPRTPPSTRISINCGAGPIGRTRRRT